MGNIDDRLHQQLAKWREELINLGRSNRLLYFKHTKTASLELTEPSPKAILDRLLTSGAQNCWDFFLPELPNEEDGVPREPPKPLPTELVVADKETPAVRSALRLLERKASQELIDRGLWVLYLGVLMLEWVDPDDEKPVQSPLLLLPVEFRRASLQDTFRLYAREDDAVINPALAAKLRSDFATELPTIDDLTEISTAEIHRAVSEAVAHQPEWSVVDRAVLTTFTFHKEAMYRDLLDNEEAVAAHPMVKMVALGTDSPTAGDFAFEPLAEESLEAKLPPEAMVSVLDADSSQRRCILAARDGASFVMDGPPGTGKSQTIVNMIAELIKTGRTVLFVSEKAAALEVVYERLRAAQLDEFVLQLHSHNATRKAVATEFGRALHSRPKARSSMPGTAVSDLQASRRQLTQYAQALNEVRQPLGRSLHEVLGRIAQLNGQMAPPAAESVDGTLTPERFSRILASTTMLGRNWGPVSRGEDFIWRDLAEVRSSSSPQRSVDDARDQLTQLARLMDALEFEFRLGCNRSPSAAPGVRDLLHLVASRPVVPSSWLTGPIAGLQPTIDEFDSLAREYHELLVDLETRVGSSWPQLDDRHREDIEQACGALAQTRHGFRVSPRTTSTQIDELSETVRSTGNSLRSLTDDARAVADAFGVAAESLKLGELTTLIELGRLGESPVLPELSWLVDATCLPAVQVAANELRAATAEYEAARAEAAASHFTDAVLEADLAGIASRSVRYRGFGKLKKSYRTDKQALASCTTSRKGETAIAKVAVALRWQQAATRLAEVEQLHAAILGQFYSGVETDFNRINAAIAVADRAMTLAGQRPNHRALARHLGCGPEPAGAIGRVARRVQKAESEVVEGLIAIGGADFPDRFRGCDLDDAAEWVKATAAQLERMRLALRAVDRVVGSQRSIEVACGLISSAEQARSIKARFDRAVAGSVEDLGPAFAGMDTDWDQLRGALDWARSVRQHCGESISEELAQTILTSASKPGALEERLAMWEKAKRALLSHFRPDRDAELAADLDSTFNDAASLLDELEQTRGDVEEWYAYAEAVEQLRTDGMGDIISFCADRRLDGSELSEVVERAMLEAWAEATIAADRDRLSPMRATERDALRLQFKALDEQLVAAAAAQVINTCAERRPTSIAGAAGVIARQAQLQKKHKPIRELLREAGSVALDLKPCFMMSPLSVSQYLPRGLTFDVVIFDEASQVRPSDAINCIYRGRQLVVAGDQNQLPPSAFFTRGGASDDGLPDDDDSAEDFESVLDLCKAAGGLTSLPLNWHYRSQHESLITYSNYSFYGGRLSTFPGATERAGDLGIELFKVDGIYRRGTGRDNPIEAAKVIDRVLHHRQHHPDQSLGVVAFSQAQEDAIMVELERRSDQYPELAGLIGEDRLRGFFVKNLEDVQGDERDIIIFSIGYGPDEFGKFTLNLGPLNRAGGWRRLNVAITRARRRVEIVTSVLPADFHGELAAEGVRQLRRYLDFAVRGMKALAIDLSDSAGDAESPFEEEVLATIRSWGFDAVPQVGCASYRLDIGIRHPDQPGTFVLAVECDGAMYHSSKVARDRDRLRQSVLEGLGWRFHRIWGISWYRDRTGEQQRLRSAIEAALREGSEAAPPAYTELQPIEVATEFVDFTAPPAWVTPYQPAKLPPADSPFDMHTPEARPKLRQLVRLAIEEEAPVHEDRVLRAVREAWNVGRAGARIRDAFDSVLSEFVRLEAVTRDRSGFIRIKGLDTREVRVPTEDPATVRPISQMPPEELETALIGITSDAGGIAPEDLRTRAARLFGWARVGPDISGALDAAISMATRTGKLIREGAHLRT